MQNIITVFGVIGLVIMAFSIWIKKENRQDLFFIFGGVCLLIYSLGIKSWIFSILQIIFIASALIELLKLKKRKIKI